MPICTSCTHRTPFLYTVYHSAHNLRLEQCTVCHAFADPYVEHDTLTLLLDLILLKRDVYRHLLFNRGLGARKVGDNVSESTATDASTVLDATTTRAPGIVSPEETMPISERLRAQARWYLILRLGIALIMVDAFIRWTHLSSHHPFDGSELDIASWNRDATAGFLRILVGSLVETTAFHVGVVLACFLVLRTLGWAHTVMPSIYADSRMPGIRQEFRYSHVPLTLLYSSFTKLFLLFLLSVWRPAPASPAAHSQTLHPNATTFSHPFLVGAVEILDEDKLDREWVVRNVLGGMSAGFGLRVVLDCHPFFTTIIILAGWAVKTAIANLISNWVGVALGGDSAGEMWLAYSIP